MVATGVLVGVRVAVAVVVKVGNVKEVLVGMGVCEATSVAVSIAK